MEVFQRSTCESRKLWENFVTAIHAIIFCKISHKTMESVFCSLLLRLKKKKHNKERCADCQNFLAQGQLKQWSTELKERRLIFRINHTSSFTTESFQAVEFKIVYLFVFCFPFSLKTVPSSQLKGKIKISTASLDWLQLPGELQESLYKYKKVYIRI